MPEHVLPADIERSSMRIIGEELRARSITLPEENAAVITRVIHATADFDFARTLFFTPGAVQTGAAALSRGVDIVTDTNMARAGVSKPGLQKLGGQVFCFMAEPEIAALAKERGTTRAAASMQYAAEMYPSAVFAVGNAPTALIRLHELIEESAFAAEPALIIGVPVGFVNVVESKELVIENSSVPYIIARGRKGGSNVAAAICNALIYQITR